MSVVSGMQYVFPTRFVFFQDATSGHTCAASVLKSLALLTCKSRVSELAQGREQEKKDCVAAGPRRAKGN